MTVIYFNMKTRASEVHPKETMDLFHESLLVLEQKDFSDRARVLRQQNKKA